MDSSSINKAIVAHTAWKIRLARAIETGSLEFTPEKINSDNLCDFGKWLYNLSASDRASSHYKIVQLLHAAFHKEAAIIVRLALAGRKTEAQENMTFLRGAFAKTSAELVIAMVDWKEELDSSVK
ncbi:MAG: CZB domain-containing protein [Bacteroidota bacterium]